MEKVRASSDAPARSGIALSGGEGDRTRGWDSSNPRSGDPAGPMKSASDARRSSSRSQAPSLKSASVRIRPCCRRTPEYCLPGCLRNREMSGVVMAIIRCCEGVSVDSCLVKEIEEAPDLFQQVQADLRVVDRVAREQVEVGRRDRVEGAGLFDGVAGG